MHDVLVMDRGFDPVYNLLIHLVSVVMRYSVVVSTPDFESGNPGSNPGTAMWARSFCILPSSRIRRTARADQPS